MHEHEHIINERYNITQTEPPWP